MDWDSNLSSAWDGASKLEVQDINNNYHQHLATFASSSGSATVMNNNNNNSMFSVDLKLGRFEDMRDLSVDTLKNPGALVMASSGSSRTRGRARNAGAQTTVYCSVDGCTSDLSQCREYHRRHRVCERHSKTPVVLIAGKEQRFCQQCSRFHSLGEFDEVKRSCRKRLDGHNRRRRKTQPENFYMNSGSLHSSHTGSNPRSNTGNGLMQFRSLQMHTTPWSMISQPDQKTTPIYNHYDPLTSFTDSISWSTICTRGDKHSSFPANITNQHETGHEQLPLLRDCTTPSATNSSKLDGLKVVSPPDRRLLTQSSHSECALSLLSRHPARSSGMYSPSHMTQPLATRSSAQGFGSALHLNDGFTQFSSTDHHTMEDENNSVSISSTTSNDNAHSFGGFLTGHDGFCANNSSRVFPFTWG